jgi:hypothetical protein
MPKYFHFAVQYSQLDKQKRNPLDDEASREDKTSHLLDTRQKQSTDDTIFDTRITKCKTTGTIKKFNLWPRLQQIEAFVCMHYIEHQHLQLFKISGLLLTANHKQPKTSIIIFLWQIFSITKITSILKVMTRQLTSF